MHLFVYTQVYTPVAIISKAAEIFFFFEMMIHWYNSDIHESTLRHSDRIYVLIQRCFPASFLPTASY